MKGPSRKSEMQKSGRHSIMLGPLRQCFRLAFISYETSCRMWSLIMSLFKPRSPAHVARKISEIIINAIQCQSRRAQTYVSKKCWEVILPFFAYSDAAPDIILMPTTPRLHFTPSLIFSRAFSHNHLRKWLTPLNARQPARSTGVRVYIPSRTDRYNTRIEEVNP
jgi:hypothetical protein